MHAPGVIDRLIVTSLVVAVAGAAYGADKAPAEGKCHAGAAAKAPTDAQLIASAMRAAPPNVSKNVTFVAMDTSGSMRTLRKGTNDFTCMPDNSATPGPDPRCMDGNALQWANAWMAHKDPPPGKVGFVYMLERGTDASNTDPYATKPDARNHWITTGPHVMIVGAETAFYDMYPKSPDPDSMQPFVTWARTPRMAAIK